jgi:hypothetical protein
VEPARSAHDGDARALIDRAASTHGPRRAVVWAHNSHLGDARATGLASLGELNLGQLVRERFNDSCWAIGMTTHDGDVTAAHNWDEPAALRLIRPSLPGSYERVFHDTGVPAFALALSGNEVARALLGPRLERAIGVIYRPETERASHYFAARLPASSTSWCMWISRGRSSPWRSGDATRSISLRPIRPECDMAISMTPSHIRIRAGAALIEGDLVVPARASGLVVFAHGSGSSRFSRRNRVVAQTLEDAGYATLLMDLLTKREEAIDVRTGEYRFDIPRLGHRVVAALDWPPACQRSRRCRSPASARVRAPLRRLSLRPHAPLRCARSCRVAAVPISRPMRCRSSSRQRC